MWNTKIAVNPRFGSLARSISLLRLSYPACVNSYKVIIPGWFGN